MADNYENSTITLIVEIRDADGDLADPTNISISAQSPDGDITSIDPDDIDNVSTGIFHAPLELTTHGWWDVIVSTSGNYDVTHAGKVYAKQRPYTPPA